jgi:hypothetical protein
MALTNRRFFLLASAAFPVACALNRRSAGPVEPSRDVRQPAAGQSWRYAKHDLFTRAVVDTQVDQVAAVGRTVDIDSHTEGTPQHAAQSSSWGSSVLRQFGGDHSKPGAVLPSEVQAPWGMVLVDPHWSQVQLFETPIPLWPAQLQPGWRTHIKSTYTTAEGRTGLSWDQTMKAEAWETITVPAGQFRTLRYTNLINFLDNDITRVDCVRRETIWFAPEVGRWVARESSGSFYVDDSAVDQPYNESGYRWELLAWT